MPRAAADGRGRHAHRLQRRRHRGHVAPDAAIAEKFPDCVEPRKAAGRNQATVGARALELIDEVAERTPRLQILEMARRVLAVLGSVLEKVEAETPEHARRVDPGRGLVGLRQPGELQIAVCFPDPVRAGPDELGRLGRRAWLRRPLSPDRPGDHSSPWRHDPFRLGHIFATSRYGRASPSLARRTTSTGQSLRID